MIVPGIGFLGVIALEILLGAYVYSGERSSGRLQAGIAALFVTFGGILAIMWVGAILEPVLVQLVLIMLYSLRGAIITNLGLESKQSQ